MFASIVLCLLILANFSFGLLSSVRAYVGGESLWSKAQKDAVYHLQKYAASRASQKSCVNFARTSRSPWETMRCSDRDGQANPDFEKVRQGFIRGGNNPDDVDGMFNLYRRFERGQFYAAGDSSLGRGRPLHRQLDEAGTRSNVRSSLPRRRPRSSKPFWPRSS
jgi:hypothetical protein